MRGSLLVTFNEVINDLGPDYFQVEKNGEAVYNQYTDVNNLYTSKIETGDVLDIDFNFQAGTGTNYSVIRDDYTTDADGEDFGIKSTTITSGYLTGGTTLSLTFTASTIPSAYKYFYKVNFEGVPILPLVITYAASNVTYSGATFSGYTEDYPAGDPITERGFIYGLDPTLTSGNLSVIATGLTGNVIYNVTNLIPFSTYYYRAYAINTFGYEYGSIESFSTSALNVTTNTMTGLTDSSFVCGGSVSPAYLAQIAEQGVFYATTTGVTTGSTKSVCPDPISSSWSFTTSGIDDLTTYYAKAYVQYTNGEYTLGNLTSGTTLGLPPTVITSGTTNLDWRDVYFVGNVTSSGSTSVTQVGFVYADNINFTGVSVTTLTQTGTTGEFTDNNSTPLNIGQTYYFKAFATNSVGTSYGATLSVTMPRYLTIRFDRSFGSGTYCNCCSGTSGGTIRLQYRLNGGAWINSTSTYQYDVLSAPLMDFQLQQTGGALQKVLHGRNYWDWTYYPDPEYYSTSCTSGGLLAANDTYDMGQFQCNGISCVVSPRYEYVVYARTCRSSCAGFGCSNTSLVC